MQKGTYIVGGLASLIDPGRLDELTGSEDVNTGTEVGEVRALVLLITAKSGGTNGNGLLGAGRAEIASCCVEQEEKKYIRQVSNSSNWKRETTTTTLSFLCTEKAKSYHFGCYCQQQQRTQRQHQQQLQTENGIFSKRHGRSKFSDWSILKWRKQYHWRQRWKQRKSLLQETCWQWKSSCPGWQPTEHPRSHQQLCHCRCSPKL